MHLYRISFVAGLAVGFVAGTRAGRERYDQMVRMAKSTREHPAFQQATTTIQAQASNLLSTAGQKVAEVAPQLAQTAAHKVGEFRHRNGHGDTDGSPQEAGNGQPYAATSSQQGDE